MKKVLRSRISVVTIVGWSLGVTGLAGSNLVNAEPGTPASRPSSLVDIRAKILDIQKDLVENTRSQKHAQANLKKIRQLIQLQREEKALGQKRMKEIEETVQELDSRQSLLKERIEVQRQTLRQFLMAIDVSVRNQPIVKFTSLHLPEQEKLEAPRRKTLANLVARGIKELKALRADLADAEGLEKKIQDEKQQLAYLFHDLDEQESILELNRQLQSDLLKQRHEKRLVQLENYQRLKVAETRVESLIGQFNARRELEKAAETEKTVSKAMVQGLFANLKGKLALPIRKGKVISGFGRILDPKSNLYIFKKGIEIQVGKKETVFAVSPGKVAFSGDLPDYGKVAIIDHGDHYYTLCAHLGHLLKKSGDAVAAGESVGTTDDLGTPVYFEIRSRNVAVNPLQWISN